MPISNCLYCKEDFRWMPSQSTGKFCSQKCRHTHLLSEKVKSGNYTKSNAKSYFRRINEYKCQICSISSWNGKPLTLQLDHIDGNNKNNLVENFRWLCPNCHTQTDTWGTKNASDEGKKRIKEASKLGRQIQLGLMPKGSKLVS